MSDATTQEGQFTANHWTQYRMTITQVAATRWYNNMAIPVKQDQAELRDTQ